MVSPQKIELLHFDADEAHIFGSLKVTIEASEHDGVRITCLDAEGGRTEVWLENTGGVLALRAYIPDILLGDGGNRLPHYSESPVLNSRLSLGNSILLLGDEETGSYRTTGISVAAGDGETTVSERTQIIKSRTFDEMVQTIEIRKPFADWLARVESELASSVTADAWREYYYQGLSPAEAVIQSRAELSV